MVKPTNRQTSSKVSTLASQVLSGKIKPTPSQIATLAASALAQDTTPGQKPRGKK